MALVLEVVWPQGSRPVDVSYKVAKIASDVRDIQQVQRYGLRRQLDAAREASASFQSVQTEQRLISRTLDAFDRDLQGLRENSQSTLEAIDSQSRILQVGLDHLVQEQIFTQQLISDVADVLRHPSETQVNELIREAERAFNAGIAATGDIRNEEFSDALRLINAALENPIGSRNFYAWFQHGWLQWRHLGNKESARQGFHQAARLSRDNPDFHSYALWHFAAVCYELGQFADAYESCIEALNDTDSKRTLEIFDAARYAALSIKRDEMLSLLKRSLTVNPATIAKVFEPDFKGFAADILAFVQTSTEQARHSAAQAVTAAQRSISECKDIMRQVRTDWVPSGEAENKLSSYQEAIKEATYLDGLSIEGVAARFRASAQSSAEGHLGNMIEKLASDQKYLTQRWESKKAEHESLLARNDERLKRESVDQQATVPPNVDFEELRVRAVIGFWIGVVLFALYMICFAVLWPKQESFIKSIASLITLVGCSGWLLLPALAWFGVLKARSDTLSRLRSSEERVRSSTASNEATSVEELNAAGREINASLDEVRGRINELRSAQTRVRRTGSHGSIA